MRISDWSSDVCSSDLFWGETSCRTCSGIRWAMFTDEGTRTLRLHDGQWLSRHAVRRRDLQPHRPHHATSRRHVRRLHQTQRLQVPRLVRCCRHRSEEHTSELQSLMRISYAVFCLKKKNTYTSLDQPQTQIK